jgi:alpha-L-fucosidase 2
MTTVILYEDDKFKGDKLVLNSSDSFLGNNFHWDGPKLDTWNDETSSIKVVDGSATFYRHALFEGKAVTLSEGSYTLASLKAHGIPNDSISSVDFG